MTIYAIDEKTKHHRVVDLAEADRLDDCGFRIVHAAPNGWIEHNGAESPIPDGYSCEFLYRNGAKDLRLEKDIYWGGVVAYRWPTAPAGPGPIQVADDHDPVNHPKHYTAHPSGIECIQITEHMGFCLGNAVKYIWRADLKADALEDLRKARWYLDREIEKREDDPHEPTDDCRN